jgi:hypothetical protein
VQPFFARSPMEFWRRWNTYVGAWFRRYVFLPAALSWHRSKLLPSPATAKCAAVLATFALAGLLHDYSVYVRFGRPRLDMLASFSLHGIAILAWLGMAALSVHAIPRRILSSKPVSAGTSLVSYVAFVHVLVLSAALLMPRTESPASGPGQLPTGELFLGR